MSSPEFIEPGVFGVWRPVLLLPDGIASHLTPAELDAILAHELCHIRRRAHGGRDVVLVPPACLVAPRSPDGRAGARLR
jgi:hypothetical protein